MLISLEGEEASGKTTFAYTAPPKVVGFSWDMGAQRALYGAKYELFEHSKVLMVPYVAGEPPEAQWQAYDIVVYELPPPIQLDSIRVKGADTLRGYFLQLFAQAVQDPVVHSLVVDTMTLARRVACDAYLEGLQDVAFNPDGSRNPKERLRERLLQIEYGAPNDFIRSIYTTTQGLKKNLVAVHHLTDEYKESIDKNGQVVQSKTGRRVLEGLSNTYRFVDVALRLAKQGHGIQATFQKCGYSLNLEDPSVRLDNPTWDNVVGLISMSLGNRIELERREAVGA